LTGAGPGFGRCIAKAIAHLGARVFATKAIDLRDCRHRPVRTASPGMKRAAIQCGM
jgi:hypothetical protein